MIVDMGQIYPRMLWEANVSQRSNSIRAGSGFYIKGESLSITECDIFRKMILVI